MTENNEMKLIEESEEFSDEEWLDRLYDKSESINTRNTAKVSLKTFDQFCQKQTGLNDKSMETMIKKYQSWNNQDKSDTRSIYLSLSKFVNFMSKDHDDIYVYTYSTFKAKTSKTIRLYFGFVKSYLRVCHGVKVTHEDVKDFIPFPKERKESRKPLSIETIKLIFGKCDPERRALYYVLVTSGMRLGEGLSLKKSNFHLEERPVRISILAEDTKTKESRDTYITSEAFERLKPILDGKCEDEFIFHSMPNVYYAVKNEIKYFTRLRERLRLTEKYPNSCRAVVNIHALRAYFITKASQKHGSDYSHALSGHGAYLKQYYREDPKERANKYLALLCFLTTKIINIL